MAHPVFSRPDYHWCIAALAGLLTKEGGTGGSKNQTVPEPLAGEVAQTYQPLMWLIELSTTTPIDESYQCA